MNTSISWSGNMSMVNPTIDVKTRAIIQRDSLNGCVIHVRVLAYCIEDQDENAKNLTPIDLSSLEPEQFAPPHLVHEVPLAFAHFLLFRTDLAASGAELQEALTTHLGSCGEGSERSRRVTEFLAGKDDGIDPACLEEAMDVADDRWIDQVATVDLFLHHSDILAADLYGACIKELLCFTNPTSGMVVAAEYPCGNDAYGAPVAHLGDVLSDFSHEETELRTVVNAYPNHSRNDSIWIVSGMAQTERCVDTSSRVRTSQFAKVN